MTGAVIQYRPNQRNHGSEQNTARGNIRIAKSIYDAMEVLTVLSRIHWQIHDASRCMERRKRPRFSIPWILVHRKKLAELKALPDDWNGYGAVAPNETAIRNAWDIIYLIHEDEVGMEPTNLLPSAEDGVGISFTRGTRRAIIECDNEGEMAAIIYERGKSSEAWPITGSLDDIRQTLDRINAFLSEHS